jgi:uncharacterized protein (TIGR00725 family)
MGARRVRSIVGVMGSGTEGHEALAVPLGRLLADLGVDLLTGGGGGVMLSVSRAFAQVSGRAGLTIGILPCASLGDRASTKPDYPNPYVDLAIRTHLPYGGDLGTDDLSRNHINILSSDAIVALPGGEGTAAEVTLALRYRKPVIVFAPDRALVAHFPEAAVRVGTLQDVERFVTGACGIG